MSLYLSRIEGPPPKRNAPGSNPGRDATKNAESLCFSRVFGFIFYLSLLRLDADYLLWAFCFASVADTLFLKNSCETFYQKKNPSEVNGATVEPKKEPQDITEEAMLNYMVQNPDFLQKFKVLLGVGN